MDIEQPSVATTNEFDEVVKLDEQKKLVYESLWELLDEDREFLFALFDAKTLIDKQKNERNVKRSYKIDPNVPTGDDLLNELIHAIIQGVPTFEYVERDLIREQLLLICDDPPPPLPCHLQLSLLAKAKDTLGFMHPEQISIVLDFLDVKSLLNFSECSKTTRDAVKHHVNMCTFTVPPISRQITTNLTYWKDLIDFFFNRAAHLVPIDRNTYSPILSQLKISKALFPITQDSMKSHIYVSFDCIKHYYIVYCDHEKPLAHTCQAKRMLDCDNKATSKVITLCQFINEYKCRLKVKDDALIWGADTSHINVNYVCMLFKNILDTMSSCIKKHDGVVEYRRTEYIANAKHHITHRIWIQASFKWDFRFGQEPQHSLYLNIADHYTWDG